MRYFIILLLFAMSSCGDHEDFSLKSEKETEDIKSEISGVGRITHDLDYKDEHGRFIFPKGIRVDYVQNDRGYFLKYNGKRYAIQKESVGENNALVLSVKGEEIKGQLVFEKTASKVSMSVHTNAGGIKRIASYDGMSVDLYAMRDINKDGCSDFILRVLDEPGQDLAFSMSNPECKYKTYYLLSEQKSEICKQLGIAESECEMVLFEVSPLIGIDSIFVQLVSADLPAKNNSALCEIKLSGGPEMNIDCIHNQSPVPRERAPRN